MLKTRELFWKFLAWFFQWRNFHQHQSCRHKPIPASSHGSRSAPARCNEFHQYGPCQRSKDPPWLLSLDSERSTWSECSKSSVPTNKKTSQSSRWCSKCIKSSRVAQENSDFDTNTTNPKSQGKWEALPYLETLANHHGSVPGGASDRPG